MSQLPWLVSDRAAREAGRPVVGQADARGRRGTGVGDGDRVGVGVAVTGGDARLGRRVLVTLRSAEVVTVFESVAVLLAGVGSVVVEVTVTELTCGLAVVPAGTV